MDDKRLPIKIIMPKQGSPVPGHGGGSVEPFRLVDSAYRKRLSEQIGAIRESLPKRVEKTGAVPVRVSLISRAIAKTHRPEKLFSEKTCPIVGAGSLGELFVKATPSGLDRLDKMVKDGNSSRRLVKDLSTVSGIEPITPEFRLASVSAEELLRKSPRRGDGFTLRVNLFDFGSDRDRKRLTADFEETCEKRDIMISRDGYSPDGLTCATECRDTRDVKALSKVIGVRSIRRMPLIRTLRPQSLGISSLPAFPARSDYSGDVPVVAVVDTGVSDELPQLNDWVVERKSYVEPAYRNAEHGTFVAGLICYPAFLNPNLEGMNSDPCGIFDLQVVPNDDPAKGNADPMDEREFLVFLENSLERWADRCKVWNVSLNTDEICSPDEFSELARQLDRLQHEYRVSFVVSAGNYWPPPLLDYPRTPLQQARGRITSPADTVLGVTVGSVSHIDYGQSGPKENEPSPFSRNGSGPNHVIKPDLVHYGGSCSKDASRMDGIRSISGTSSVENMGTSFASPLVSRTLAQIYHYVTPEPSPVLARALLTHHSRDPRTGGRVPDGEEKFFGFGMPAPVPYCLECTRHSSTLVFEEELVPGSSVEWDNFPYPPSLYRDGRYYGEIWMTLVFAPVLGTEWGAEYCETHIEASFGVYYEKISESTGEVTKKFHGLVPPEHRNPGDPYLYETHQIADLRKWAPVRTYHAKIGSRGRRGLRWRLKMRLLARHGIDRNGDLEAQPFSLIITIADPENKAPVYDEMARMVRSQFDAQNLVVKSPARVRARG